MDVRGGGLLLATDHAAYQPGINEINGLIGLEPFHGSFNLNTIPVDTASPLMTLPNDMGPVLSDDSSPGQTPYGLQPNGDIMYTVAWHSNNHDTPGISSTIEGVVGMHVEITSPPDQSIFLPADTVDLSAAITGGDSPFTYEWSWTGGILGTGQSIAVPASTFPMGDTPITVLARDAFLRTDDDSVEITLIPEPATLSLLAVGGLVLIRRRRGA